MQDRCTRPVVSAYAAWHQIVTICTEWWCTEANEATQTHCYNPVAPAYPVWAYHAHGRRCQEDPVSLLSGRLEKTTRSSPHHVAQHHPTGSETTPPYAHHLMIMVWPNLEGVSPSPAETRLNFIMLKTPSRGSGVWTSCLRLLRSSVHCRDSNLWSSDHKFDTLPLGYHTTQVPGNFRVRFS